MKFIIKSEVLLSAVLLISISASQVIKANPLLNQSKMEKKENPDSNKVVIRKLYNEILNTGKLELLDQVVADGFTGPKGTKGPAGFASTVKPVISAFPDIKWAIEDIIAEGDKVVVRWSWKGTNKSSFDGFNATNKEVSHHAINIFQFNHGKIINAWMQSDRLGFYQQIGVISPDAIKSTAKN